MGNYEQLKNSIAEVIKTNGNQEITGQILQNVLKSIVSTLGDNATFAGVAEPTTNPGTPDQNVFWLATESGNYSNFAGIALTNRPIIFSNKNNSWVGYELNIATAEYVENAIAGIKPIIIQGDVVNAADEEDITSINDLLKFKNRQSVSGMGYVIIRKTSPFSSQIAEKTNTIFEIRYDVDLNGAIIQIPANCTLFFNGGSLSNGTIVLQNTSIKSANRCFNNIVIKGDYSGTFKLKWIGIDSSSPNCASLLNSVGVILVDKRVCCLESSIVCDGEVLFPKNFKLYGNNCTITNNKQSGEYLFAALQGVELNDITLRAGSVQFSGDILRVSTNIRTFDVNDTVHNISLSNVTIGGVWNEGKVYNSTGIHFIASNESVLDNKNYLTSMNLHNLYIDWVNKGVVIENYNVEAATSQNFAWSNTIRIDGLYVSAINTGVVCKNYGKTSIASSVSPYIIDYFLFQSLSATSSIGFEVDNSRLVINTYCYYDGQIRGILRNNSAVIVPVSAEGYGNYQKNQTDAEGNTYDNVCNFRVYGNNRLIFNEYGTINKAFDIFRPGYDLTSGSKKFHIETETDGYFVNPFSDNLGSYEARKHISLNRGSLENTLIEKQYSSAISNIPVSTNIYRRSSFTQVCSNYGVNHGLIFSKWRPIIDNPRMRMYQLSYGRIYVVLKLNSIVERQAYYHVKARLKWLLNGEQVDLTSIRTAKSSEGFLFDVEKIETSPSIESVYCSAGGDDTVEMKLIANSNWDNRYIYLTIKLSDTILGNIDTNTINSLKDDHQPVDVEFTTVTKFTNFKFSGPTSDRPNNMGSNENRLRGFTYFDTTLGKPVFWLNSSQWVDANGNIV